MSRGASRFERKSLRSLGREPEEDDDPDPLDDCEYGDDEQPDWMLWVSAPAPHEDTMVPAWVAPHAVESYLRARSYESLRGTRACPVYGCEPYVCWCLTLLTYFVQAYARSGVSHLQHPSYELLTQNAAPNWTCTHDHYG